MASVGIAEVALFEGRLRLRPKDIRDRYGISLTPIYTAIYKGELRARRFQNRIWLIEPQDVEDWIQRNSVSNVDAA
ncbi:MAG: helix-turn-helix domain-containing protein [Thermomicrobiales bacterium]